MALGPGARLGPYEIQSAIGAGGMGEVYKARDTRLDRTVAVKVLPAEFSVDPDHRHRFEHEAHAIAALNHPHICTVYDVGRDMGIEYLVMEYIDGPTLRERLQDGLLPLDELLTIVADVAEGLSEAHERGIVHRDLKPGNIMLTRNGAKLLDFGLAKKVRPLDPESTALQTATGVILGTVAYMSPERLLGLPADQKGDVFSLGVVLYEMVAGARPFGGTNMIETIDAILHQSPERISRPDLESVPELDRVVFKCLEKDAADRYSSATDLLYEIQCLQRRTTLAQPVQAVPFRRHNLPLDLTSFVGRERELEELKRLLDGARCVSLVGAGGCGKTRLALKTASEMLDKFRDGVRVLELAAVSNPDLVPQALASALGVQGDQERPLTEVLIDYLETKHVLLVVDNCEHLVGACAALVETLLKSCANLRVLVTSREPLRMSGETIWRVPSLTFPETHERDIEISDAAAYEAVRLFVERARTVTPFNLDERTVKHVAEICRRLDGIPLALEMAAARLNVLSVNQIAERLSDRFRLFSGAFSRTLPRQQTLRATLDWSYDLLPPAEQRLFQRLAVFAGSFSLDAVEAVCSDKHLKSEDVLEVLSRLVEKSMLTVKRTTGGPRYRLLETLREYARERSRKRLDARITRDRHADFFLNLAEQLEPEFYAAKQTAPLIDRVEEDHQNLLVALEWCKTGPERSLGGLRLATALRPFWDVRCYHQLAKNLLLQALDRDEGRAPKPIRAKALDAAGYFLFKLDEHDLARRYYEESLRLADESGAPGLVANALYWLAVVASWQERHSDAEVLQRRSLEISREHGFMTQVANALDHLGCLAYDRGEHQLAQSYCEEGLDIFRQLGSKAGITRSLFSLGMVTFGRADHRTSDAIYTEALALAKETGHQGNIAFALIRLGDVHSGSDVQRSRVLYTEALTIGRDVGYKRITAIALTQLGGISSDQGEYVEADRHLNESCQLLAQLHSERSLLAAQCLLRMSRVSYERGRFDDALDLCYRVMRFEAFECSTLLREYVFRQLGWIRLAQDDRAGASNAFEESLTLARESGSSLGLADAQLGCGYLELLSGTLGDARSQFEAAFSSYEGRNNRAGMINALLALADAALVEGELERAMVVALRAMRLGRDLGFNKSVARALRSLGTIASRQDRPEIGARCFGASDVLLEAITGTLPSFQSIGYEAAVAVARSELGFDVFQHLHCAGGAMPVDEVDELFGEHVDR